MTQLHDRTAWFPDEWPSVSQSHVTFVVLASDKTTNVAKTTGPTEAAVHVALVIRIGRLGFEPRVCPSFASATLSRFVPFVEFS